MTSFVEIAQLGKTYETPTGPAVIVQDFTLYVDEGEFVCLLGHSGCGKTTVLSILMGLATPSTGGVVIGGREIDGPGTDRGVVFQSATLLPWMSVRDNVRLARDRVASPADRALGSQAKNRWQARLARGGPSPRPCCGSQNRHHGHPRRGRGPSARRPDRHDDQRSRRDDWTDLRRAVSPTAPPRRAAGACGLLLAPGLDRRLSRGAGSCHRVRPAPRPRWAGNRRCARTAAWGAGSSCKFRAAG